MEPEETISFVSAPANSYWLTRFLMLRLLGFVYLIAFLIAAHQLVPLVGADGLTPANQYLNHVRDASGGSSWSGFINLPSLFWIGCSDNGMVAISWIGFALSFVVLAGFANSIIMFVLWVLYMSIIHIGQGWYGYGWEIQLLETGFLAIFLCPLLDARPFPRRETPVPVIFLYRWLIVRCMIGAGLVKMRGDPCWRDLTALYYFYETQPIPGPLSRYLHFLPKAWLQILVLWNHFIELVAPWFAFGPRWCRYGAGILFIIFQIVLIIGGNLSFLNYLTIIPALACIDDSVWRRLLPGWFVQFADNARDEATECVPMQRTAMALAVIIAILSVNPVLNLLSSKQIMNTSFDPLHLVNTYGAFGAVQRERFAIIFEGTDDLKVTDDTKWKEYGFVGLPSDPTVAPPQIAPYQPRLDWQLWFAAMGPPQQSPWAIHLVWNLLHNDQNTIGLFGVNPFPIDPPKFIRAVLYRYSFAAPGNPNHVYWNRDKLDLWLPPMGLGDPKLIELMHQAGWLDQQ